MLNKKLVVLMLCASLAAVSLAGCGKSESIAEDVVIDFDISDVDDMDLGSDIEAVEADDSALDAFSGIGDIDIEIDAPEPVEPADTSFDFNVTVPDMDFSDIEAVEAKNVSIEFDIPDFDIDFSSIEPVEPVKYDPSFTISYPELDFSDIEMAEADDSAVIKGIKGSFADNVYADDYDAINAMDEEALIDITERKFSLLADLDAAFDAAGIDVDIDEISGEVTLDSAVLFDFDKNEVSAKGKEFLSKFVPAYASVVLGDKYDGFVKAVLVEGHTDTNGDYDYNLKLSQERADNVMDYCLSIGEDAKLGEVMRAIGFSYNDPIYAADGTVDAAASRRVSFRFIINVK